MHENSLKNLEALTPEKAKEIGKIGGVNSGKVKRQRKAVREYLADALNADIQSIDSKNLLIRFLPEIPEDEQNTLLLGVVKVVRDFISDDIRPLERIKILDSLTALLEEKSIDLNELRRRNDELFEQKLFANMTNEELFELAYGNKKTGN